MWTIFKAFIEFVRILLLFYVFLSWPQGLWDLNSPTRDQTHTPYIRSAESEPLNHQGSPLCSIIFLRFIHTTAHIGALFLCMNE